jgi:hypothetical protein
VLGALVDRDEEAQRLDEVRSYVEEYLPVLQGLPNQRHLIVLQVAQAAVDQARRPLRRAAGDVPLVQK